MPKKKDLLEHHCELPPEEDFAYAIVSANTLVARIKRLILRAITISTKHVHARRLFRSTTAINLERARHMKQKTRLIHPLSLFREVWNIFMLLVYLYALFLIPIYVAFVATAPGSLRLWIYMDFMQCILCLIDIGVNFCTGYIQEQHVIILPWKIVVRYLFTYFIFDFLSSIPFDTILCVIMNRCFFCELLVFLRLAKYARVMTTYNYFRLAFDVLRMPYVFVQGAWMITLSIYILNFVCSLQFVCSYMQVESNEFTWILQEELYPRNSTGRKYLCSFFRSSSCFWALGCGLTRPDTAIDKGLVIMVAFAGTLFMIISIGKVLQWTYIFLTSIALYDEIMQQLNSYMRYKRLPLALKKRLIQYYQFRYQEHFFNETEVLNSLPSQLRQEIVLQTCWQLVENVSFFNNLPVALLTRIVVSLHAEFFLANDVIVKAGAMGDSMFFISLGTVAIYTPTGMEVCHLEDGAHFGEVALMHESQRRVASVVAVESCELYRLQGDEFKKAISPYPDLVARIHRIAEERYERTAQLEEKHRRRQGRKKRDGK